MEKIRGAWPEPVRQGHRTSPAEGPRGTSTASLLRELYQRGQMPRAVATVFDHSKKTVFWPSRLRHQESGRKNWSGAATIRMAGPAAMARPAAGKMGPGRRG